jgi:NADPH:quinone reductase-like Zn-dependent oxidoreductase
MKGNKNMKAAIIREYGTQVEIAEVSRPELLADGVLIEVHAASINPIDNIVRAGYMKDMMPITFPYTLGYDVSGVVLEVGDGVSNFKKGDAVYARLGQMQEGTIAEFVAVKEEDLALKPLNISHEEAASIPLAGYHPNRISR